MSENLGIVFVYHKTMRSIICATVMLQCAVVLPALAEKNVNPPAPDPLWKLQWLLDHLNRQFHDAYLPYGVSVDETMVNNKSRFVFKQHMPMKPTKWGVKVLILAETLTGYAYHIQVYTG